MSLFNTLDRRRGVALSNWAVALAAVIGLLAPCSCVGQDASAPYTIGPDDVINISVARHPELSGEFYVPVDGSVTLPVAGAIEMSGKSLDQIAASIAGHLKTRLRNPEVTVTLKTPRRLQVYVMGAVSKPGLYEMKPDWRCSEAIAAAGGLAPEMRPEECKASIRRASTGRSEPVDLSTLLRQGSSEPGPQVQNGDTLLIDGPETMPVYVTGKVKNPGLYKVRRDGATLTQALTLAGGESDNAAMSRVTITHVSGTTDSHDLATGARTGKPETNVKLQPLDIVTVPEENARIAVLGYVNEPGFFQVKSTDTITLIDAISQAKGTQKKANVGSVAVVRTEDGRQQRLMFDLNKFLRSGDPSGNPSLRPGDVVYVAGSGKPDWNEVLGSAAAIALVINPFL